MALEKTTLVDKIEVVDTPNGYPVVLARTATIVTEDGTEISRSFSRDSHLPNVDTTGLDSRVSAICNATFTDAHRDALTAHEAASLAGA
jgi:hypothetical protein